MSKQTFFKRAALAIVASLGFGLLSAPSSQAALVTSSLTLSSATATATTGDTATGSWTTRWTTDTYTAYGHGDTVTVRYSCDAPAGASCPAILGRQLPTADTANIVVNSGRSPAPGAGTTTGQPAPWVDISPSNINGWTDSAISTGGPGGVNARSAVSFKAAGFTKAGTYTYTFYLVSGHVNAVVSASSSTWTVTVTGPNTTASSIAASYFTTDNLTAANARYNYGLNGNVPGASTDSAIVAAAGAATASTLVGVLYVLPANSAGDTRVAVADGFQVVQDTLTATITGAGTISANSGSTKSSSATMNVSANDDGSVQYSGESLTVFSNGTVGTGTITLKTAAGVTLLTKTVTFTGPAASASVALSDTYTHVGGTVNLLAQVKDSGPNLLGSGTLYVMASDTKIVSAGATLYSNASTQYQTSGRCGNTSGQWDSTTLRLTCGLTISDTGTVTIYLADSWNATAATFTASVELTVTGNTVASATVAFDKATYSPGERAVITITTKDVAGRLQALGHTGSLGNVTSNYTLTGVTTSPLRGTNTSGTDVTYSGTITEYLDTSVETRVVTMPSFGADVTYSVSFPTFGSSTGANTTVSATAKVTDPNATAIAGSIAAAEAATDAAAEAIDAANAATDAANLAAEAADAATVAAEEARDAADAATAAIEELATQVATLMAALKAQITTLANTVAKIAKKVKA